MGRKVTVVGTQIQRMIEDEFVPSSMESGVANALLKNENISEHITEGMLNGMGVRAELLYEYADQGRYHYGIPKARLRSFKAGTDAVQLVLDNIEGTPVDLEYVHLGPINIQHIGWTELIKQHSYNPSTNQIEGIFKGADEDIPVYLHDMVVHVPKNQLDQYRPGALELWGIPPNAGFTPERENVSTVFGSLREGTPVHAGDNTPSEAVEIHIVWDSGIDSAAGGDIPVSPYKKEKFFLALPPILNDDGEFFQARYVVNGVTKFWTYKAGAGSHPTLDAIADEPEEVGGAFFPITYFRYDKKSELEDKNSRGYKTSKDMLRKVGMDFDDIAETINENPDIEDVIHAMMMFGVRPDTKNAIEQQYLFRFFEQLFYAQDVDLRIGNWGGVEARPVRLGHRQVMTDGWNTAVIDIADSRFTMRLEARGIYRDTMVGVIGPVGSYTGGEGTAPYTMNYRDPANEYDYQLTEDMPYYYYQYQLSENIYEEVRVFGLRNQYMVYGERHLTSSDDRKNPNADNLLIVPLDRTITKKFSLIIREELYARSLHMVFNSMQVIKLKWYQTGLFQIFMLIVAVVISYFFPPAGQLMSAIVAAGVTGFAAALVYTFVSSVISQLVGMLVQLVVSALGKKLAIVVAVIMAALGVYRMIDAKSVMGAPFARELLQLSSSVVVSAYKEGMVELQQDYEDFEEYKEDKLEELENARSLLNDSIRVNPLIVWGETPNNYYARTVHNPNPGLAGIEAISSYVDISLRLPDLNDTLNQLPFTTT